jgi:hypothetical protein
MEPGFLVSVLKAGFNNPGYYKGTREVLNQKFKLLQQ